MKADLICALVASSCTSNSVSFDPNNSNAHTPTEVVATLTISNLVDTPSSTWFTEPSDFTKQSDFDGSGISQDPDTDLYSGQATITYTVSDEVAEYPATITVTANAADQNLTDSSTIIKLTEGTDGTSPKSVVLTNENHYAPALDNVVNDADLIAGALTDAGGTALAYDGNTPASNETYTVIGGAVDGDYHVLTNADGLKFKEYEYIVILAFFMVSRPYTVYVSIKI